MAFEIKNPQWKTGPIRGILFDMDGVILDSEKLYCRFWQEALQSLGYPMTRELALGMRSLNRQAGQEYLTRCFGPGVDYVQAREKRIELMDCFVHEHGIEPKPGIHELLDELNAMGIAAAITTASPIDRAREHLTPLGLWERFDKICSARQVAKGKPEPDIYLFGAASLGLEPRECLAIEDSDTGILSAFRAGCLPVMIPDQAPPLSETLPRLYALAESLLDVIEILHH